MTTAKKRKRPIGILARHELFVEVLVITTKPYVPRREAEVCFGQILQRLA